MTEPKTFEEFESYVQKKAYLYPITSELLSWGKADNTEEFWYHREGIKRLWDRYKKSPTVECIIGFTHYLSETDRALKTFPKYNNKLIDSLMQRDKKGNILGMELYDVTTCSVESERNSFILRKSVDPKRGCKMFADALKGNKHHICAFKGPKIHKWKKDGKGDIMRDDNDNGDFRVDINDEVIFYSVICSPSNDPFYKIRHGKTPDFRFIADTEILDIAEYYREKHPKEYRRMKSGKDSCCYGAYLDEVLEARKKTGAKDDEAVYFMTVEADPLGDYDMFYTADRFAEMYNEIKIGCNEGIGGIEILLCHGELNRYSTAITLSVLREIRNEEYKNVSRDEWCRIRKKMKDSNKHLSDFEIKILQKKLEKAWLKHQFRKVEGLYNRLKDQGRTLCEEEINGLFKKMYGLAKVELKEEIVHEKIFDIFNFNMHDRIPHSYVGSVFKSGEIGVIKEILEKEKTEEGLRGFLIKSPQINSEYVSNVRGSGILEKALEEVNSFNKKFSNSLSNTRNRFYSGDLELEIRQGLNFLFYNIEHFDDEQFEELLDNLEGKLSEEEKMERMLNKAGIHYKRGSDGAKNA
jgi:hypothetical protein